MILGTSLGVISETEIPHRSSNSESRDISHNLKSFLRHIMHRPGLIGCCANKINLIPPFWSACLKPRKWTVMHLCVRVSILPIAIFPIGFWKMWYILLFIFINYPLWQLCLSFHTLCNLIWFDLLCLTPLSALFQLFHCDQV